MLTTDYVIDETLTLLRVRGERKRALALGAKFFQHDLAEIHKVTASDHSPTLRFLRKRFAARPARPAASRVRVAGSGISAPSNV